MKILIISALPYDISSSTRAFRTYFQLFNKADLAQIFTNPNIPSTEFCSNYFQITDKRMLKRFFGSKKEAGICINSQLVTSEKKSSVPSFLKKDNGLIHTFRDIVWKEKNWFTEDLKNWLIDFSPDCIFYHNSNSIFLSKITRKLTEYLQKPLIMEVSDDYYFEKKRNSSYNRKYKKIFEELLNKASGCLFISEKMKEKYAQFNAKNADVVHVASDIAYAESNKPQGNTFCFFGNTGFNRTKTLELLGKQLFTINPQYVIDVYSPILGNGKLQKLDGKHGIKICGFLPYDDLIQAIRNYEYVIIAEPLDKKTAEYISLSLSTKVGDSLALGKRIICAGNEVAGTIDYIKQRKAGLVLNSDEDINNLTADTFESFDWENTKEICKNLFNRDFSMESNANKAFNIISTAIKENL